MSSRIVSDAELRETLKAYERSGGNKAAAADLINLNRSTFNQRFDKAIKKFGKPEIEGVFYKLTDEMLREAFEAYKASGAHKQRAADMLGLKRSAYTHRLDAALKKFGGKGEDFKPKVEAPRTSARWEPEIEQPDQKPNEPFVKLITGVEETEIGILRSKIRQLESQIKSINRDTLSEESVRREIYKIANLQIQEPDWMLKPGTDPGSPGVPTLFASDWHWGEVVDPNQINGVNHYNIAESQKRAWSMITNAVNLLENHIHHKEYPGIVFALGGDMVSGDIHEELSVSNELEIMPTVQDIIGILFWCIKKLADVFGRVFIPCVTGNHGRTTHKIRAKGRNFTSHDWNIYASLQRELMSDSRITFQISDGSDCFYRIYNHRYLLTHGDQFRGGDGMIGALGPIMRGDHKKRSRNGQIDMTYDTLLMGHFHQLIQTDRVIVNGSLKGYDEYAYVSNFGFERPRQALWITHPTKGITFSTPILVDECKEQAPAKYWVSWQEENKNIVQDGDWMVWK